MTTIDRPYWIHSDPEPPAPLCASESVYVASPPSECLNGCENPRSAPHSHDPAQLLCASCRKRLDKWLRAIPDVFALLPAVVMHGTVPSDPGTKHTRRPDPPAPMRLEVIDLLDQRPGYGALGILHSWAELVRDERAIPHQCACGHEDQRHRWAPPLLAHCRAEKCTCDYYERAQSTVAGEAATLIVNLAWCTGQAFAGDLYQEIRVLARTLDDTVGEYRPKPVGRCPAMLDETSVCGGPLVMDREGTGVHCLRCPNKVAADGGLRELGLIVDRMFRDNRSNHQEAS